MDQVGGLDSSQVLKWVSLGMYSCLNIIPYFVGSSYTGHRNLTFSTTVYWH